jgi:hypothetical protein
MILNNKISKIAKYVYAGLNIVLALYILINTSFLQTTLYHYIAEQHGLTKSEQVNPAERAQSLHLPFSVINSYEQGENTKPFDFHKIYYLLAVITYSHFFTPKRVLNNHAIRAVFRRILKFFRFFRPLYCVSAIALRAPPIYA